MDTISKTSIASQAALLLGQPIVRSITDTEDEFAIMANNRFDFAVNAVLRMHDWSSCKDRAILSPETDAPSFEWSYSFNLPSQCVKVLRVSTTGTNITYQLQGRKILANEQSIQLEYIKYPDPIGVIDYSLAEAIAFYLAWSCARKVTSDTNQKGELWNEFQLILNQAKAADKEGDRKRQFRASQWAQARFSGDMEYVPTDQVIHS